PVCRLMLTLSDKSVKTHKQQKRDQSRLPCLVTFFYLIYLSLRYLMQQILLMKEFHHDVEDQCWLVPDFDSTKISSLHLSHRLTASCSIMFFFVVGKLL